MEVILKQDVDNLGQKGEVIRVAPGYARNFLIPHDLAVAATANNLKNLRDFIAASEKKRVAERDEAQQLADRIAALEVTIEARAGEKNRLFGSVTSQEIAEFVNAALELSIDKKKVNTAGGIKTLGKHIVRITVYPGVVVDKEIEVIAMAGVAEEASSDTTTVENPTAEAAAENAQPAEVIEESQETVAVEVTDEESNPE